MQTSEDAYARLLTEKLKVTRQENPFAGLTESSHNPFAVLDSLEAPESNDNLLDQTRVPLIDDVESEIVFLKRVREQLENSVVAHSRERIDALIDRCVNRVRLYLKDITKPLKEVDKDGEEKITRVQKYDDDEIESIADIVNVTIEKHLCRDQISIQEAKALRDASSAIAKMVEQYRKFVAGMTIKVEFDDPKYERLMGVIFKVCDPATQMRIVEEMDKYAVQAGRGQTMTI